MPVSGAEITSLRAAFKEKSGDGNIREADFQAVMTKLGFAGLPLLRMFQLFDTDGNGEIDYREFLCGLIVLKRSGEDSLEFCFRVYDSDNNGYITQDELSRVLGVIATDDERSEAEKATQLQRVFEAMDLNGDGKISYEEFKVRLVCFDSLSLCSHSPPVCPRL